MEKIKLSKSKIAKLAQEYITEDLNKKNKMSFGEYLYKYHFGEYNFAWEECNKDYQELFEEKGKQIILEVLRRNKLNNEKS